MSMKIEIMDNYPEEIKRYIEDYNKGIELQDIMEVNLAIDSLLTLVFHSEKNLRDYAGIILKKIANIQPGFLKKGVQVLLHRYKSNDQEKSEFASIVLGLITETPAKNLITDSELLQVIQEEHAERVSRKKFEEEQKKEFLQRVMTKEVSLFGLSGEILRIGQFYNKLIVDEDDIAARKVVEDLITTIIKYYGSEENKEDFEMGCTLFKIICDPEKREPFIEDVIKELIKNYELSKKKNREAYTELIINSIASIEDLLPQKYRMDFASLAKKREAEKKKESLQKIKLIQELQKKSINVVVTWEKDVKALANLYNDSIKENNEKGLSKFVDGLKAALFSKDEYIKKSANELYSQILEKNFPLVEQFTLKMINDYKKPEVSIILQNNIQLLANRELLKLGIKNYLIEQKIAREEFEKKEREKQRKEFERIEKLKIEFSASWDKRLVDVIDQINNFLISEKIKGAEKLILGTMKNYIYAEDSEISKQAIEFLNNVAKKYPKIIKKIMKEIIELFQSEHEARVIAIDLLGLFRKNPNKKLLFEDIDYEKIKDKLKEDLEKRQKDLQQAQLMDKWDAIKLDVTTIVINLEYDKKLQRICRAYNEAIKAKDKEKVIKNVQLIVDWFLEEKNEEKLNQVIEVLGKIAKQNIELIAPAIDMFLKMVDSKDEDKKFRAIKGLGEVTVQRPGWAYMGIEKLVQIVNSDDNENARMKALLELSRVGRSNPTMLIEHKEPIIAALKDSNKHVRRLAAYTIGAMAEAIPLEAQEAIPALRDALHDEYFLVRQFADKALKLIRAAMRR